MALSVLVGHLQPLVTYPLHDTQESFLVSSPDPKNSTLVPSRGPQDLRDDAQSPLWPTGFCRMWPDSAAQSCKSESSTNPSSASSELCDFGQLAGAFWVLLPLSPKGR